VSTTEYILLQQMDVPWNLVAFLIIAVGYTVCVFALLQVSDWLKSVIAANFYKPQALINWYPWDVMVAVVLVVMFFDYAFHIDSVVLK